jgi:hypothetical protein
MFRLRTIPLSKSRGIVSEIGERELPFRLGGGRESAQLELCRLIEDKRTKTDTIKRCLSLLRGDLPFKDNENHYLICSGGFSREDKKDRPIGKISPIRRHFEERWINLA